METLTPLPEDPNRYRAKPTVMEALRSPKTVSYTHLTLPTIYSV